ncbi:MAG: hypothetical protein IMW89_06115 [Ktedonobacteraceae bacterium]|nr:hypothetical protein [Ktedonobacteraceae bacterium]
MDSRHFPPQEHIPFYAAQDEDDRTVPRFVDEQQAAGQFQDPAIVPLARRQDSSGPIREPAHLPDPVQGASTVHSHGGGLLNHSFPLTGSRPAIFWRNKRYLLLCIVFLFGFLSGAVVVLASIMLTVDRPLLGSGAVAGKTAIVIQLSPSYIALLIQKESQSSSTPLNDVHVQIARDGPMTVTADTQVGVGGVSVARRLTMIVQPIVRSCHLQMHVVHADLSGVPTTMFVSEVETQMNRQLLNSQNQLPDGFTYCATGVRTAPDGIFVTYSATSTK